MKHFFSSVEYNEILFECRSLVTSPKVALKKIVNLLKRSEISLFYSDNKLQYINTYVVGDYINYTSSIIRIPEKHAIYNFKDPYSKINGFIEEELTIVKDIIFKINEAFKKTDILYKEVFIDKYIYGLSVKKIQNKYMIDKRNYYKHINYAEELVMEKLNLIEKVRIK